MISILYFETESLHEPRAQQLARLAGQQSEEDPDSVYFLLCPQTYTRLEIHTTMPGFLHDCWGSELRSSHLGIRHFTYLYPSLQPHKVGFRVVSIADVTHPLFYWFSHCLLQLVVDSSPLNTTAALSFNPYEDPLLFTVMSWGWLCICCRDKRDRFKDSLMG